MIVCIKGILSISVKTERQHLDFGFWFEMVMMDLVGVRIPSLGEGNGKCLYRMRANVYLIISGSSKSQCSCSPNGRR